MSWLLPSILLSALPAVLLILYFLKLDRARPEPRGLVVKAVLYGFLAVLPAATAELALQATVMPLFGRSILAAAVQGFLVAGLVEEGVKYWFVKRFLFRRPEFDEVADGVVYAVCVSMGFALVENVMYGLGGGLAVILVRAFTSVPLHAAATGIMGYFFGLTKMGYGDYRGRGLAWAVLIHGFYDFSIFLGGPWPALAVVTVIVASLALRRLFKNAVGMDDLSQQNERSM